MSFKHFHERGLGAPADDFFQGLLHYYKLERNNLNPNDIVFTSVFVGVCAGNLGIEPYFDLWKHFYSTTMFLKNAHGGGKIAVRAGGVMF